MWIHPFIALALFFLSFCSSNYRFITENLKESGESVYIKNFSRYFFNEQLKTSWLLEAEEAFLFEDSLSSIKSASYKRDHVQDQVMVAYDFSFTKYDKRNRAELIVQANRGDLRNKGRILLLGTKDGQVSYTNKKQTRISSNEMKYDFGTGILSSQSLVRIESKNLTSVCLSGIKINSASGAHTCLSPRLNQKNNNSNRKYRSFEDVLESTF